MHRIKLSGCDDSTVIECELDPSELAILERVAALSVQASEYDCMPILEVEEIADEPDGEPIPDDPDSSRDREQAIRDGVW